MVKKEKLDPAKVYVQKAKTPQAQAKANGWKRGFRDMFGFFGSNAEPHAAEPDPERRATSSLQRKSFAVLDLEGNEPKAAIKARFKELVKRHHPDANGGDRSSEDRLREIIQAYNHLKSAGFC